MSALVVQLAEVPVNWRRLVVLACRRDIPVALDERFTNPPRHLHPPFRLVLLFDPPLLAVPPIAAFIRGHVSKHVATGVEEHGGCGCYGQAINGDTYLLVQRGWRCFDVHVSPLRMEFPVRVGIARVGVAVAVAWSTCGKCLAFQR